MYFFKTNQMLCAANLVDGCVRRRAALLYVMTKQIYGLCNTHGVKNVNGLFDEYCYVIHMLLKNTLVRMSCK